MSEKFKTISKNEERNINILISDLKDIYSCDFLPANTDYKHYCCFFVNKRSKSPWEKGIDRPKCKHRTVQHTIITCGD